TFVSDWGIFRLSHGGRNDAATDRGGPVIPRAHAVISGPGEVSMLSCLTATLHKGLALLLIAWAPAPAHRDMIELKSGQKIEAPVLKEEPDALFLDLGFDVLRVPTASISKRTHRGDATPPPAASEAECFLSARLPVRTVKELAATYGEGVVLV